MFSVWLCMSAGVCPEALEVHLWNICQGSSVITSLKSRGERDRSDENGLWRNIRGKDAIKRDAKRGNCGGRQRWRGRTKILLGRMQEALPVGFKPSDRTLGSCSVHMSSIIYLMDTLKSLNDEGCLIVQLCRHWSVLQRLNTQAIWACRELSYRWFRSTHNL